MSAAQPVFGENGAVLNPDEAAGGPPRPGRVIDPETGVILHEPGVRESQRLRLFLRKGVMWDGTGIVRRARLNRTRSIIWRLSLLASIAGWAAAVLLDGQAAWAGVALLAFGAAMLVMQERRVAQINLGEFRTLSGRALKQGEIRNHGAAIALQSVAPFLMILSLIALRKAAPDGILVAPLAAGLLLLAGWLLDWRFTRRLDRDG